MGTKNNPGEADCYIRAMPDEPLFTVLARDVCAPEVVRFWAALRAIQVHQGDKPASDLTLVDEAKACADAMDRWRAENDGAWRNSDLHDGLLAGAKP